METASERSFAASTLAQSTGMLTPTTSTFTNPNLEHHHDVLANTYSELGSRIRARYGRVTSPSFTAIPKPGSTYIIRTVSEQWYLTLRNGQLELVREPDGRNSTHWRCVESVGWLGFINEASGKYLGYNNRDKMVCEAIHQQQWENFTIRHVDGPRRSTLSTSRQQGLEDDDDHGDIDDDTDHDIYEGKGEEDEEDEEEAQNEPGYVLLATHRHLFSLSLREVGISIDTDTLSLVKLSPDETKGGVVWQFADTNCIPYADIDI